MHLDITQAALRLKNSTVTISQDEVSLNPSMMVFSISAENRYESLPRSTLKYFRAVSCSSPDMITILEAGLIKSGMLLCTNVVPQIADFLNTVKEVIPCFSTGFGQQRLKGITNCFLLSFKEMLKCKDGQKIAKELSSVTEITESLHNEYLLDEVPEELSTEDFTSKFIGY